jgi:hypothetical protein
VVSIIALLISILLPSLKAARDQAKAVRCLSNLRQYGTASQYYVQDTGGTYLPCYNISRHYGNPSLKQTMTPYWFQYLPFMYLSNQLEISECPADRGFEDVDVPGNLRGPYSNLDEGGLPSQVYFSYAMNPNQPKRAEPVYPDTNEGKLEVAPVVVPYDVEEVVERFNPGYVDRIKRPAEFGFLMETASQALIRPRDPFEWFRFAHANKRVMTVTFADTHATTMGQKDIYPGNFEVFPVGTPDDDAWQWEAKYRGFWFGDLDAVRADLY